MLTRLAPTFSRQVIVRVSFHALENIRSMTAQSTACIDVLGVRQRSRRPKNSLSQTTMLTHPNLAPGLRWKHSPGPGPGAVPPLRVLQLRIMDHVEEETQSCMACPACAARRSLDSPAIALTLTLVEAGAGAGAGGPLPALLLSALGGVGGGSFWMGWLGAGRLIAGPTRSTTLAVTM